MKKIFIIGLAISIMGGIAFGIYLNGSLFSITNYDYICGVDVGRWSDCQDGLWSEENQTEKEMLSLSGVKIPPYSQIYKGTKVRISKLKYGNTKTGCDGVLRFSTLDEGHILKLKDSKGHIRKVVDILSPGNIILKGGDSVFFRPVERAPCTKTKPLSKPKISTHKSRTRKKRRSRR